MTKAKRREASYTPKAIDEAWNIVVLLYPVADLAKFKFEIRRIARRRKKGKVGKK